MKLAESNDIPFTPESRGEKILFAIYYRLGSMDLSSSPEKVGQAMEEYSKTHSEFWGNIPDGTITRAKLADEVPEQIRDETLKPISTDEIVSIFNSVFHN